MRQGVFAYLYRLAKTKTRQSGDDGEADAMKPIAGVAAVALQQWLAVAQLNGGPLFRRIRGTKVAEPLSPQAVRNIVRRLAGVSDAGYSAHSLRSGFMTEAGRHQMHLRDAMQLSDHRTVEVARCAIGEDTRVAADLGSSAGTPRWVKVFGVIALVLILLFAIVHLTGDGLADHFAS